MNEKEQALDELVAARAYQAEMLAHWEQRLTRFKVMNAKLVETVARRDHELKPLARHCAALEAALGQMERTIASQKEALAWRDGQVEDLQKTIALQKQALDWRTGQAEDLQKALEWRTGQAEDLQKTISSQDEALAWRAREAEDLQKALEWRTGQAEDLQKTISSQDEALAWRAREAEDLQNTIDSIMGELAATRASDTFVIGLKIRNARDRLFPDGTWRRQLVDRVTARAMSRREG